MKNSRSVGERGLIKMVVLIIIGLLIISYFGINLRSVADSPTTRDNFSYAATTTVMVWDKYLKKPVTYVWKEIFLELIWKPSIHNLIEARNS